LENGCSGLVENKRKDVGKWPLGDGGLAGGEGHRGGHGGDG